MESLWLYRFLDNKKQPIKVKCKSIAGEELFADNKSREDFCEAESVSYRFQSPGVDTITQDGEDGEGNVRYLTSEHSIDGRVRYTSKRTRVINRTVTTKAPVFQLDFVHRLDPSAVGIMRLAKGEQKSNERLDVILQHFIHEGPRMRLDIQLELKNVIILYAGIYTRVESGPGAPVQVPVDHHAPEGFHPAETRDLFTLHRTDPHRGDISDNSVPHTAVFQRVSLQTTDVSVTYKDAENLNAAFMSDLFGETIVG